MSYKLEIPALLLLSTIKMNATNIQNCGEWHDRSKLSHFPQTSVINDCLISNYYSTY